MMRVASDGLLTASRIISLSAKRLGRNACREGFFFSPPNPLDVLHALVWQRARRNDNGGEIG